jgi:hypothetical protein
MSIGNLGFPIKNATNGAATEIGKIMEQQCKYKKLWSNSANIRNQHRIQ